LLRGVLDEDVLPALEQGLRYVKLPVDGLKECHLVRVDFIDREARNLAPSTRRVVAVLKIFRCKNQCSKKHASAALQGATPVSVNRLFHSEVEFRNMSLDDDQVVECYLKCRKACAGPPQCLLDKGAEW